MTIHGIFSSKHIFLNVVIQLLSFLLEKWLVAAERKKKKNLYTPVVSKLECVQHNGMKDDEL